MIKVVISGYGRMGRFVEEALKARGVECVGWSEDIASFDKEVAKDCVCIDFTSPAAFRANYKTIAENFKSAVIGTTGWNDIQDEVVTCFEELGTPMIFSSNYSVGVNVLAAAVELVSKKLSKAGGYSPYIIEKHHIHKKDAPSGTAKSLAAIVEESFPTGFSVSSVRVGEVAGIHTIGFEGENDRITIEHEAFSRKGFAEGAVVAALMTEGLVGVHEFKELFSKQL